MKNWLLFDIDNTLLDFKAAEEIALKLLYDELNIPFTEETRAPYEAINRSLWLRHERGEIDQETLLSTRFEEGFAAFNVPYSGHELDHKFRSYLEDNPILMPHAHEVIEILEKNYHLGIVTNGVAKTQYKRLEKAGIRPFFEHLFISEEIGAAKPSPIFFNHVKCVLHIESSQNVTVIGDNYNADIMGALNAGFDAVWYTQNTQSENNRIRVIHDLKDLLNVF